MRSGVGRDVSGFVVAVVVTVIVALARVRLSDLLGDIARFTPFVLAVMVAAWYGGLRPGLLATFLSGVTNILLFAWPHGTLQLDTPQWGGVAFFLVVGVAVAWLCESLHATRQRLDAEQDKLKESNEFHEAIADLSADFAFAFRVEPDQSLVVEALSDGFTKLSGYNDNELASRGGWTSVVHPEDMAAVEQGIAELLAGRTVDGRLRIIAKDARVIWLRYRIRSVRDGAGRVARLYGAAEDTTREHETEERRRDSETRERMARQQLQIVTDTMSALVTRCSRDLRYLWVSEPYAAWLDRSPDEIIGRPIAEVLGAETFAHLRPHFEKVLAGERVEYEDELSLARVGRRWVSAVYTPTLDAGGIPDGWVAVIADIDERKRAENELRDADKRKDEFLATLAHELRNPLAPIRNAVQILRAEESTAPQRQAARDVIDRQVKQMVLLIDDLLDINRITRNTLQVRKETVELGTVLQSAVETSRPAIAAAGHELTVTLPPEIILLEADPTRLAQVFSNLLNNAATYTESGGRIWLSAKRVGEEIVVSVRDTGVGIANENLKEIFEMFSQVTPALERSRGGLGIGLALARGLVNLHGGSIDAHSDGPGTGSEFTVRLPVPPPPEKVQPQSTSEATTPMSSSRRVLVVDDNRDSAESLAVILRMRGNEVCTAFDGLEALEASSTFRPEVVLLDIGLPGLNGYEVARRIRALPRGQETILVAITGWGQEEDKRRSRTAGFDYHLVKPVDPVALESLIASLPTPSTRVSDRAVEDHA